MPKGGKKGGHKGRMRTFNNPEEIDAQMKAEKERKKLQEEEAGASLNDAEGEKLPGSGSEDSDDEDGSQKGKGVEGLIDIEDPNRVAQKNKKVTEIQLEEPRALSRREREEIEKQKAKERYMKMHLAGKTDRPKQIWPGWQSSENRGRMRRVRKKRRGKLKRRQRRHPGVSALSLSSDT
uniref:28 kDa heat-and acid-stable phosphoprotein n=1 Tax=Esox lucius TaxID=8010 RepID=C1BYG5_ESOLU|nr:28 kDa heat- and acid-stable phosphoprotein [Esox lucius]